MPSKGTPDKKIVKLAFSIKPVMAGAGDDLHFIKSPDLYRALLLEGEVKTGLPARSLKRITEVDLELPIGMYDAHFPTAAQVLSQLPKRFHKIATAYSVKVTDGFLSGDEGYVRARATLYKGLLPKAVSDETVVAMGQKFKQPPAAKPVFDAVAAVTAKQPIAVMKPLVFKKPEGPPQP
jgi:hypothetical protein